MKGVDSKRSAEFASFYGTLFPDLEGKQDEPPKKGQHYVENQIATDDKGRRRFHGAFTGGFSAGHFNSVGTEEGWAPTNFSSSRAAKSSKSGQRPEDYMDDEDLGQYGISERKITTAEMFSAVAEKGETRKLAWERSAVGGPAEDFDILGDLIKPVNDSFGIKLLKKMGWRQGRGVGPQVKRKVAQKRYSCALPPTQISLEPGDEPLNENENNCLIDQDDVNEFIFEPKTDFKGLGFVGLLDTHVLDEKFAMKDSVLRIGTSGLLDKKAAPPKKSKGIRGQAFGVGVFEEEDDDVYATEDISKYDFAIGGDAKAVKKDRIVQDDSEFALAKRPQPAKKFFNVPRIPPNFEPAPGGVKCIQKIIDSIRDKQGRNPTSVSDTARKSRFGPPIPAPVLASKMAREEEMRKPPPSEPKVFKKMVPLAPKTHGSERVSKFRSNDPKKEKRFNEYLRYLNQGSIMPRPSDLTEWEWASEKSEFGLYLSDALREEAKRLSQPLAAAKRPDLIRPLAERLAARFQTGEKDEPENGGLNVKNERPESTAFIGRNCLDPDKLRAVEMKMFGAITREKFEWHPDRVLCKRFNVPVPYPDSKIVGIPGLQTKSFDAELGVVGFSTTEDEIKMKRQVKANEEAEMKFTSAPRRKFDQRPEESTIRNYEEPKSSDLEQVVVEPSLGDIILERPPMDLFKSIFASDEESSEDEGVSELPQIVDDNRLLNSSAQLDVMLGGPSTSKIDLTSKYPKLRDSGSEIEIVENDNGDADDFAFGPALPPSADGPELPPFSVIAKHRSKHSKTKKKNTRKKESKSVKRKKHKRTVDIISVSSDSWASE